MDRGIRQDLGGLLEGRCGQERVSGQGCLGDTKDDLFSFRGAFAFRDQGFVPVFKIKDIDQAAGQEAGVAAVLDPDLFQHLPYDDFNMLIADINALKTVYPLDLTQQVILDCLDALDLKQIVGVDRTFCQLIAGLNGRVVQYLDTGSVRNRIVLGFTGLIIGDNDFTALLVILDADLTAELGDDGKSLGLSGLEQLLDTGKTLCDIAAGDTAGMEGTHGQLGTGLTDRLGGNDADRLTDLDHFTGRHVGAVALGADPQVGTAGQDGTDLDGLDLLAPFVNAPAEDGVRPAGCDHVIALDQDIAFRVTDILTGYTSCDSVLQALDGLLAVHERLDVHTGDHIFAFGTVHFTDDQFLGYVDHSSGQVTGVSGTKGCIGQTLTGTVG